MFNTRASAEQFEKSLINQSKNNSLVFVMPPSQNPCLACDDYFTYVYDPQLLDLLSQSQAPDLEEFLPDESDFAPWISESELLSEQLFGNNSDFEQTLKNLELAEKNLPENLAEIANAEEFLKDFEF